MSNKKIDLTLKNTDVPQPDKCLRIGEPFYYEPTNDLFVGDGQKPIENLVPVRANMAVAEHVKNGTEHKFILKSLVGTLDTDFYFVVKFSENGHTGDTVKLVLTNGNTVFSPEIDIYFKSPIDGIKKDKLNIVFVHLFSNTTGLASLPFYNSSGDICIIQGIASPYAAGTVSGAGAYHAGEEVTLEATEQEGYEFEKWSDESTVNPKVFQASQNESFIAYFKAKRHTITLTAGTGGSVNASPNPDPNDNKYAYGTVVTLTANPDPGYRFESWSDGSTNSQRQITVKNDASYTANFKKVYTITLNANTGGTVKFSDTPWGTTLTKICDVNSTVEFEAQAENPIGYSFSQWSDGDSTNPRTITVTGDATYSASFAVNSYTITTSVTPSIGGHIDKTPNESTYPYGSQVTLTAVPESGYAFVKWINNNSTIPTQTITVTGNDTWTAEFYLIPVSHTIRVQVDTNNSQRGLVRITGPNFDTGWGNDVSQSIEDGTSGVEIQSKSIDGYIFSHWQDDTAQNPRPINIDSDITYTAYFDINNYTIRTSSNPSTGGIASGGGTYAFGSRATITATPNSNYSFLKWTKNGVQVSTNTLYTFDVEASAGTQEYIAQFTYAPVLYTFNVSSNPTQGGIATGGNNYPENYLVTLQATPASGWYFVKWTKNGTDYSTDPTIILHANSSTEGTYIAYFEQGTSYTVYASSQIMGLDVNPKQTTITYRPSVQTPPITYTISKENYQYGGQTYLPHIADGITPCGYFDQDQTLESDVREWAIVEDYDDESRAIIPLSGARGLKSYSISDGGGTYTHYVVLVPTPVELTAGGTGGTLSETSKSLPIDLSDTTFTLSNVSLDGGVVLVDYDSYPTYTLTVNGGTYSTASKSPNLQNYLAGSQVEIECKPVSNNYVFVRWSDGNTDRCRTVTVTQNSTYTAIVGEKVIITTGSWPNDAGETQGESQYVVQSTATIKSFPYTYDNYFFDYWTAGMNGSIVSHDAFYEFTVTGPGSYIAHCLQATNQAQWASSPSFSQSDNDDNELWNVYMTSLLVPSKFVSKEEVFNKIEIGEYGEIIYSYVLNGEPPIRTVTVYDENGMWLNSAYRTIRFVDNPLTIVNDNFDWKCCFAYNGLITYPYTAIVTELSGLQIAPTSGEYSGSSVTFIVSKHQAFQGYSTVIANNSNVVITINTSAGEWVEDSQGDIDDWTRYEDDGDERNYIPKLNEYGIKHLTVKNEDDTDLRTLDVIVVPRDCKISTTSGLLTQGQSQGNSLNLIVTNLPINVSFSNATSSAQITFTKK